MKSFPQPRGLRSWLMVRYLALPDHPAKLRVVRWLGRFVLPERGAVARVDPGVWLHLHPADWVEYILLRDGRYDALTLRFVQRNVVPGSTAVVAGVNFGLHLAVAALAAGAGGRAIGIEPQPRSLLRARANLALNPIPGNVTLVQGALMDRDAMVFMPWSQDFNHGAASFFDPGADGLQVHCRPLSTILRDLGVGRPRMIVLDIQGSETRAFAGFADDSWPDILVVRCDPHYLGLTGETPASLRARLASQGYAFFDVHGAAADAADVAPAELNLVAARPAAGALAWV